MAHFLGGRIGFMDIPALAAAVLEAVPSVELTSIEDVIQTDAEARRAAEAKVATLRHN